MSLLQMSPRTNLSPKRTFSVRALFISRGSISINFLKIFNSFHFCFDQKDRPVELRQDWKISPREKGWETLDGSRVVERGKAGGYIVGV